MAKKQNDEVTIAEMATSMNICRGTARSLMSAMSGPSVSIMGHTLPAEVKKYIEDQLQDLALVAFDAGKESVTGKNAYPSFGGIPPAPGKKKTKPPLWTMPKRLDLN